LVSGFENYLRTYYFNWLNSCLLVGACWHPLLNMPRVILKKACCTASSPNNSKLSSPGNRSLIAQSRDSSSGNSVPSSTVEFWPEVSCAFVANPAGTTDYLLFRVKEGFGVRPVVEGAWQTPLRIWWTTYFR